MLSWREVVDRAVESSAEAIALERGVPAEGIHRMGVCRVMSSNIVLSLYETGANVTSESKATTRLDEHRFVVVNPGVSGEFVIDATWQQFLPKDVDTTGLPSSLVGSRAEVIAMATALGVSAQDAEVWRPLIPGEEPRHLTPQELAMRGAQERM